VNGIYVRPEPDVVNQLRKLLPAGWKATRLALDGSVIDDVANQLSDLPGDATHLVLSIGGNDLLLSAEVLLRTPVALSSEAFLLLAREIGVFESRYRSALEACLERGLPLVVCTIYNGNSPDQQFQTLARVVVAAYNDSILRLAREEGLRTIDLRFVCTRPEHYANEIEPSARGGRKIARAIWQAISSEN
jgi:hypothetical protein